MIKPELTIGLKLTKSELSLILAAIENEAYVAKCQAVRSKILMAIDSIEFKAMLVS